MVAKKDWSPGSSTPSRSESWNVGMRLLESLEVQDSESEAAPADGSTTGGSKQS
jgi:hypothetical protein